MSPSTVCRSSARASSSKPSSRLTVGRTSRNEPAPSSPPPNPTHPRGGGRPPPPPHPARSREILGFRGAPPPPQTPPPPGGASVSASPDLRRVQEIFGLARTLALPADRLQRKLPTTRYLLACCLHGAYRGFTGGNGAAMGRLR